MGDFLQALDVAASGLKAQSRRLRHVSENIANADTPGYRRKTVAFDTVEARTPLGKKGATSGNVQRVETGKVSLDRSDLERVYDPTHPLADESGHFQGSNVNLLIEIADAREAQRSYEANLKMFDQARQMSSSLLDLLRR